MNEFVISLSVAAILGVSLTIAWRLRKLIDEIKNVCQKFNDACETNQANTIAGFNEILNKIPDTFEYNGNKGRIYKK